MCNCVQYKTSPTQQRATTGQRFSWNWISCLLTVTSGKYTISEWADCQVWKFLHPQGWKTPLKLAQGQKFLPPKGRRPVGGKYFFPRANLGGFFNPRDEEIFIPDNHGPFGNCIPVRVNQAIFLFFLVIFRLSFDKFLDVQVFSNKNLYKNLQKLVKPQQMKFCPCGNQISFQ